MLHGKAAPGVEYISEFFCWFSFSSSHTSSWSVAVEAGQTRACVQVGHAPAAAPQAAGILVTRPCAGMARARLEMRRTRLILQTDRLAGARPKAGAELCLGTLSAPAVFGGCAHAQACRGRRLLLLRVAATVLHSTRSQTVRHVLHWCTWMRPHTMPQLMHTISPEPFSIVLQSLQPHGVFGPAGGR